MQTVRVRVALPALIAGILMLLFMAQHSIDRKARRQILEVQALREAPTTVLLAALGGFRGLAADIMWMKADDLFHGASWWRMEPVLSMVVKLDPHFLLAWQTKGWHEAWNLNAAETTAVGKRYWVERGIRTFREGMQQNPNVWDIYWELAWLYFDRIKELDEAEAVLEQIRWRFPDRPPWMDHVYVRVQEKSWRIPGIFFGLYRNLTDQPNDMIMRRDLDYWAQAWNDRKQFERILTQENQIRKNRGVPQMELQARWPQPVEEYRAELARLVREENARRARHNAGLARTNRERAAHRLPLFPRLSPLKVGDPFAGNPWPPGFK